MFKKDTRKALMSPKPLVFKSPNMSNPSKTWGDYKRITNTSINDMVLLFQKLSPEKRNELYNLQNFKKLFDVLLSTREMDNIIELDIAVYIMEKSVNIFKKRYSGQNVNTQVLASVITDYLEKALEICKDISYKEKLKQPLPEIDNKKLGYLCNWNEVVGREKKYLLNFINFCMDHHTKELNIRYHKNGKNIVGYFNGWIPDKDEPIKFYIDLAIDHSKSKATLTIDDREGYKQTKNFIVKSKGDDSLLFYGKEEIDFMEAIGVPHNIFMDY